MATSVLTELQLLSREDAAAGQAHVRVDRPDTIEDARILIVDDDATAATLMSRLLTRDGFRDIVTLGDGREALAMMSEYPPEVIILDVHMPHLDGFELLRELHRNDIRTSTTTGVLVVSGDHSPTTCSAMLTAGADDFVLRPFSGTEFALRVPRLASATYILRQTIDYVDRLKSRIRELDDRDLMSDVARPPTAEREDSLTLDE